MSATNKELEQMANELYKELGGMRTRNGRIVRALLAKWKAAEANIDVMLAEAKMNQELAKKPVILMSTCVHGYMEGDCIHSTCINHATA